MTGIKDIVIPSFAITELKLSGNELVCYALIYGMGETDIYPHSYIASILGTTRDNARKIVERLVSKGLISKEDGYIGDVKVNRYTCTEIVHTCTKTVHTCTKTMPPQAENEPSHLIVINNNNNNTEEKEEIKKEIYKERKEEREDTSSSSSVNNKKKKETPSREMVAAALELRKKKFQETIRPYVEKYGRDMCNDFYGYWTEPNKSMTKMRFELQQTWDIRRRLSNWASRNTQSWGGGRAIPLKVSAQVNTHQPWRATGMTEEEWNMYQESLKRKAE